MTFVPYLFDNACKTLGVEDVEAAAKDLSLNSLALAVSERNGKPYPGTSAMPGKLEDLAYHYADKLLSGDMIVFRDPFDNRTYYAVMHGDALVAVYYTLGRWYDIFSVISTDPAVLETLEVTKRNFKDLAIIDRIFRFDVRQGKAIELATPVTIVPDHQPAVTFYAPVTVAEVQEEVVEPEVSVRDVHAVGVPMVTTVQMHTHAPKAEAVQETSAPVDTAMGRAFAAAGANPARGGERRSIERRDSPERREMAQQGSDENRTRAPA